ncbi:MAG TPA: hypothetical protein VMU28_03775 [Terriglobales bacterium]|nr:hypothetical protein [Terriglobales bacterium]
MIDFVLVPEKTVITANGDGLPIALDSAAGSVLLVNLKIAKIVEQESFELTIFGSADGQTWTPKPLLRFPQKFYEGETPMLLDLSSQPEVKQVRAHWEVNRWGRGPERPMFEIVVTARQVPTEMLQSA